MTSSTADLKAKRIATRFVYPFFFERDKADDASRALLKVSIEGRGDKSIPIWECCEPPDLYREELLDHVDDFLFRNTRRGCKYLSVSSGAASKWFNNLEAILGPEKPKSNDGKSLEDEPLKCPVKLFSPAGIEIFLTNYGVGLISIALTPHPVEPGFHSITLFNYKLAQLRPKVAAGLRVRHPADDQDTWARLAPEQKAKAAPAPADDAPLHQRVGARGGKFTLGEMVTDFLLQPLKELSLKGFQDQFSVFTTVRFSEEVDFNLPEVKRTLSPFLSAITQIEEPGHAGTPEDVLFVTNAVLNRRHWTAVGLLGVAHIVSDQPNEHPFNDARVTRVITKYFIPYLTAMLQRMSLQRNIREASEFVLHEKKETEVGLAKLRRHMLEFAVEGYFPEISHREVLDRYYRMLREGLGIRRAYEDISRSIAEIDAKFAAEHQATVSESMERSLHATRKLQEEAAKVQHKVSLLERFLVSVYAAELWHLIASNIDRLHKWEPHGVIAFAILGFLGAWAIEKLWQDRQTTAEV